MPSLTKKHELENKLSQVTVMRKAASSESIQLFDILNKIELLLAGQLTDTKGKTLNNFTFRLGSGTVKAVNNRGHLSMTRTTQQGILPFTRLEMNNEVHRVMLQFKALEEEITSTLLEYESLIRDFQSKENAINEVHEFQDKRIQFDKEMQSIRRENITMNESLIQERIILDQQWLKHKNTVKRLSSNRVIIKLGLFLFVSISYNIMSILHIV